MALDPNLVRANRRRDALAEEDREDPPEEVPEDDAEENDNVPNENPVQETERYTSDGTVIPAYDVAGDEAIVAAPPEVISQGGDPTLPKGDGERHNTPFVNAFQPPLNRYVPIVAIPYMKYMN